MMNPMWWGCGWDGEAGPRFLGPLVHVRVLAKADNPVAVATLGGAVDKRLLPFMTHDEFYDLYLMHANTENPASRACFLSVLRAPPNPYQTATKEPKTTSIPIPQANTTQVH